jgi:carboxylesterase
MAKFNNSLFWSHGPMTLENKPFLLQGSTSHACLMLHGLGGGPYEMQFLGQFLNQQGLTVQAVIYPGHDVAGMMPRSRWEDWYARSVDAYQTLAQTYDQISVLGFSTGCPLGLYLASERPVYKLVMLAPYLRLQSKRSFGLPLELLVRTVGRVVTDVPRRGLPIFDPEMHQQGHSAAFHRTFNIPSVRSAMQLIQRVKPRLPSLKNPILIIQSRPDTVVDPAGAAYLYRNIGSADKTLCWLEDSNHIITLDRERLQVYETVGEFLKSDN